MGPAVERHVWPNQCPGTNLDFASIEDTAIEVQKDSLSDFDVGTVVNLEWCLNPGIVFEQGVVGFLIRVLRWERTGVANDADW